jgi:hypothetical protein
MGYLAYDGSARVSFDDVVLAHLEVVIISKLQRKESFALSWRESSANGGGRSTIWLDPTIPLRFRFVDAGPVAIDRDWVRRLAESANSGHGLIARDGNGDECVGPSAP